MASEKVPSELEEDILVRVPPLSIARFRTRFVNNHLARARPEFILRAKCNLYSKLMIYIPSYCDGLLLCALNSGATIWNLWLRQTRQNKVQLFSLYGIRYDSNSLERMSLMNGNFSWIAYNKATLEYFIKIFDCSKEIFKPLSIRPCKYYVRYHSLAVFKGDQFLILEQCIRTKRIEIWVTKNKIKNEDGEMVWIKFMTVSIPNCMLYNTWHGSSPSYFVDNNIYGKIMRLGRWSTPLRVVCCNDACGQACNFIVRGDHAKKIKIDSVAATDSVQSHRFWL
ncbi:hypothetical protein EUTSA_v10002898mg [Eutrema salsugineum]|uniref:F-box associated beta-propeller type 1 domain-containing protein n=1 Tax=Eutrema salsugineum TaxID=72664 RepID=V4L070_EUTSA|nr:hypothetical protein EUTSA_v10002898mg [Eutrema salsugineum]